MGISIETVAAEVRKVIKGSGFRLEMFTEDGEQTLDDRLARRFFVKPSNVMITVDEADAFLKLHKPDTTSLEEIEGLHSTLKNLSRKYRLNFDYRSFGHALKPKDYAHQAIKSINDEELTMRQMAEGMSPMAGSTKSSYQLVDNNVKLIVRHTKPVDETVRGSRSRNIKALFIENGAGERFQYPHIHLAGARAMARHVTMGGTPYDSIGNHISKLSEDYKKLQRFVRYAKSNNVVNEQTADVLEAVKARYHDIRSELSCLKGAKCYTERVNSIHEDAYETTDDQITEIRNMFTAKTFDESLEEVLPLISQIVEYRLSKDAKTSVGDKLAGAAGLELVKQKVANAQFNEPGEDAAEYASSNIIKFASSPEGQRDEVAYKIREMAGLINDELLTSFLGKVSDQFTNDEYPGEETIEVVKELLNKANEQGVFGKKDAVDIDADDDEFAQQDTQDMPDDFDPPREESKIFKDWIDSVVDDKALFEEIVVSEDEFVDFNRALASAKDRMRTLPRMGDGSPLVRKIKGMCEEVGLEYDVKAEDLYAALSGEAVINEGDPVEESSPAPDGPDYQKGDLVVMPDGKNYILDEYDDGIWWATDDDGGDIEFKPGTEQHHEPAVKTAETVDNYTDDTFKDAIALAYDMAGNYTGAYNKIIELYGEEVADSDEVQQALYKANVEESVNRVKHLAGIEPVVEKAMLTFRFDPAIWTDDRIEDEIASMDGAAWNMDEGTVTASGVHPETLNVLNALAQDENSGVELGDMKELPRNMAVRAESEDKDEEEQIDEAQSEAQKAAFQKMLDAKNGNKEETTEDADAEKDDEVEESIELDRIKHLAGV